MLGPIPWLIGAEVLDNNARASGMSTAAAVNWLCTFIVGLCFPKVFLLLFIIPQCMPQINELLGEWTFLTFACSLFLTWIFIYFFVPEVAHKEQAEIQVNKNHLCNILLLVFL